MLKQLFVDVYDLLKDKPVSSDNTTHLYESLRDTNACLNRDFVPQHSSQSYDPVLALGEGHILYIASSPALQGAILEP